MFSKKIIIFQQKPILKLLNKPEELLGMILIGNTFANITASAILTKYILNKFNQFGIIISTILLTFIILMFAEIIPKTLATKFPQQISLASAFILNFLMYIFYPIVFVSKIFSRLFFIIIGVKILDKTKDENALSSSEIHSVVHESKNKIGNRNKNMLLSVLELDQIKVSEIMIPHSKVEYINIMLPIDNIIESIIRAHHSILIVYQENIQNIIGILSIKEALTILAKNKTINLQKIKNIIKEPYYIPENVSVGVQLLNFQDKGKRFSIIVNEYGDIQGILTAEDILEEIVGEFSDKYTNHIKELSNDVHIISGEMTIREINRHLQLHLSTQGAKTISGFIIDKLQEIPTGRCCIKIQNYIIEATKINKQIIKLVKIIKL